MKTFLLAAFRHPVAVLLVTAGLCILAAWQLPKLEVRVSSDELMPHHSPARAAYDATVSAFGSDEIILVYAGDPDLFTVEKLELLQQLNRDIAKLPFVQRTESLFTATTVHGEDGWIETSPLLRNIPQSREELLHIRDLATADPLLQRNLVAKDGDALAIIAYIQRDINIDADFERQAFSQVEELLNPLQADFSALFQIGSPALHVAVSEMISRDQKVLLPLAGGALLLLLGLLLRNVWAAFLPILNAAIATVLTLGLMAALGLPLTMLNYIVPALILVIGATEDIHMLAEFRASRRAGFSPGDAVGHIGEKIGLTLILTGITTVLGFSATMLNDIVVMREFGMIAATAMLIRFTVSLTVLPAVLRIAPAPKATATAAQAQVAADPGNDLPGRLTDFVVNHRKWVFAISLLIFVPALFYATRITMSNDLLSFIDPKSRIVKEVRTVSKELSGTKIIYLTLHNEPGAFRRTEALQQLDAITRFLRQQPGFQSVISLSDYIALVNQAMRGGDDAFYKVPDSNPLIAQYLMFFHPADLAPYVTGDFSKANIVIRSDIDDSHVLNQLIGELEYSIAAGRFGPVAADFTGKSVMVAAAVETIALGQVASLGTMITILFLFVAGLFLSLRCGFLAILANMFPIAILFGTMGLFNIPLNVGTCMVAAITIGIAIDDTLHLMVRYNRVLKDSNQEKDAIRAAIRAEVLPVTITSIALAGGFILLTTSSFIPVYQFGILSATVILVALFTDLILSPALLSTVRLITLWDCIGLKMRRELIEKSQVLRGMSPLQVKKVILASKIEEAKGGSKIIHCGDTGDTMYVILEGEVHVSKPSANGPIPLGTLSTGDAFGEVALVSAVERTADVTATSDTRLLVFNWEALHRIQRFSPYIASRLFLNLAAIIGVRLQENLARLEQSRSDS